MDQDHNTPNPPATQGSAALDQRLLQTEKLISALGTECVKRLILGTEAKSDSLVEQQPSLSAALLAKVAALGVELTPSMVALVVNSDVQAVEASITIYATYKKYKKVDKPNGLFYKILINRKQG